jgi:hypothetical protein
MTKCKNLRIDLDLDKACSEEHSNTPIPECRKCKSLKNADFLAMDTYRKCFDCDISAWTRRWGFDWPK